MSQRFAGSWFVSPPPGLAVEIDAGRITGVAIADQGNSREVSAYASEPLAEGVAAPSLNAQNVPDERRLADAIGNVLQKIASRSRRIALVLPDAVAKVSLVRFDKVPEKAQDLEQLVRWQVRKAVPFRIEDAQVAWQRGAAIAGGGREYLVTIARRDVIRSYERACEMAGVHAGVVDLATFNQINAILAGEPITGDWLLIHVTVDAATLSVVRDGEMLFYRNRSVAGETELADLVHQTAMYHEDRLGGGGFARVILAGASVLGLELTDHLRRTLQERIGTKVEPIDFRPAAGIRNWIAAGPELLDLLAPSVGILVRERAVRRRGARGAASERVA